MRGIDTSQSKCVACSECANGYKQVHYLTNQSPTFSSNSPAECTSVVTTDCGGLTCTLDQSTNVLAIEIDDQSVVGSYIITYSIASGDNGFSDSYTVTVTFNQQLTLSTDTTDWLCLHFF